MKMTRPISFGARATYVDRILKGAKSCDLLHRGATFRWNLDAVQTKTARLYRAQHVPALRSPTRRTDRPVDIGRKIAIVCCVNV